MKTCGIAPPDRAAYVSQLEQWNGSNGKLLGREGGVNKAPHADIIGICISAKYKNETAHNMPIEILGNICREANASQFPTSLNRAHPNSTKMGMQEFSYSNRKILFLREFSVPEPVQKLRSTMRVWLTD
jgi:hypothetical protein